MYKAKEGYNKGKWLCVGATVVCDSKESCKEFEKDYYNMDKNTRGKQ